MNINIRRETFIKWYDTWKVVEWKMLFDWAELLLLGRGFVLFLLLSRSVKIYFFDLAVCARHGGEFHPPGKLQYKNFFHLLQILIKNKMM